MKQIPRLEIEQILAELKGTCGLYIEHLGTGEVFEVNGDNKINWLTFYNTSFTFNIDPNDADVTVGSDGYCNNL
ncbi:MAG: hypothetical protein II263_01045, partial [Lachnospiraceae bacterium]|nr:hypothetical protein [Lachnospiraceae bacterium]